MSCNKCGSSFNHAEKRGTNIGLYCDECNSWIKWLSKDEAQGYKVLDPEKANDVCGKCGSGYSHAEKRGPHVGLYCDDCGSWVRWLSKAEIKNYKVIEPEKIRLDSKEVDSNKRSNKMSLKDYCIRSGNITDMVNGVLVCCDFSCGNAQGIVNFCPVCGKFVVEKSNF